MVLTTKEASYIIVFGIVISVLQISSTMWPYYIPALLAGNLKHKDHFTNF